MIYATTHMFHDVRYCIKRYIICLNPNSIPSTKTSHCGSLNGLISLTVVVNFWVQIYHRNVVRNHPDVPFIFFFVRSSAFSNQIDGLFIELLQLKEAYLHVP